MSEQQEKAVAEAVEKVMRDRLSLKTHRAWDEALVREGYAAAVRDGAGVCKKLREESYAAAKDAKLREEHFKFIDRGDAFDTARAAIDALGTP